MEADGGAAAAPHERSPEKELQVQPCGSVCVRRLGKHLSPFAFFLIWTDLTLATTSKGWVFFSSTVVRFTKKKKNPLLDKHILCSSPPTRLSFEKCAIPPPCLSSFPPLSLTLFPLSPLHFVRLPPVLFLYFSRLFVFF